MRKYLQPTFHTAHISPDSTYIYEICVKIGAVLSFIGSFCNRMSLNLYPCSKEIQLHSGRIHFVWFRIIVLRSKTSCEKGFSDIFCIVNNSIEFRMYFNGKDNGWLFRQSEMIYIHKMRNKDNVLNILSMPFVVNS